MAEEILRSKHAFGNSENLESAISSGKVDAYDILFLDGGTDKPKIGWIDKNGNAVILKDEKADLSEIEADVDALESEVAKKANADEVDARIDELATNTVAEANAYTDEKIEAAINEHMTKKYEFTNVPVGTLVDYREDEIRIMCPVNAEFTEQSVGAGGDPNCYYGTLITYAPSDAVVGYVEHLGNLVDSEILTDLKVDSYGRKYQQTWLALARYVEAIGWTYYGATSSTEKYIGWDYQIDWYNADNMMISSDTIRINLSNENCHSENKPYYVGSMMKEVDAIIEEKLAEISAFEIVEF